MVCGISVLSSWTIKVCGANLTIESCKFFNLIRISALSQIIFQKFGKTKNNLIYVEFIQALHYIQIMCFTTFNKK